MARRKAKYPPALFDAADEPKRVEMRQRGWSDVALPGGRWWKDPRGNLLTEEEAFAQFNRSLSEKGA